MKTLKKSLIALAMTLSFALMFAFAACGSYSLDVGTYTGTYKCHYESDYTITTTGPNAGTQHLHGSHWGAVVAFEVDKNNAIWNVTVTAPEADAESGNAEYVTYVNAGMSNVFLSQFGGWTPTEIMNINVTTNSSGFPTAIDGNGKQLTIAAGQTAQCGTVILAMQSAIESAK